MERWGWRRAVVGGGSAVLAAGLALTAGADVGMGAGKVSGGAAGVVPGMTNVSTRVDGPTVPGLDVYRGTSTELLAREAANGRRFVWVKATEGSDYADAGFAGRYAEATRLGMVRGAYHFARPDTSSGTQQANWFVDQTARYGGVWRPDGRTLPGALDLEAYPVKLGYCYGKSPNQIVAWVAEFSRQYERRTGHTPVIYTNTPWWRDCTGDSRAFADSHALWLANHGSSPSPLPGGWSAARFWQHSATPFDQDVWFGTEAELRNWARRVPAGINRYRNSSTGRCLTAAASGTVTTARCSGSKSQSWGVAGSQMVTLRNRLSGRCLDSDRAGRVRAVRCAGTPSQRWWVGYLPGGVRKFFDLDTGRTLDVNRKGVVVTMPASRAPSQRWQR